MLLPQAQADKLILMLKEAVRNTILAWEESVRYDEPLVAVHDNGIEFVLSLNRNPFEIRLHLRTQKNNIGLCRLDASAYHPNPDGTELRNMPHLHVYREGDDLQWAEAFDWYDLTNPKATLERFLDEIHARFPNGIQATFI